jgi:hypothetical protein
VEVSSSLLDSDQAARRLQRPPVGMRLDPFREEEAAA